VGRLTRRLTEDPALSGLRVHGFGYESPKLRWPWSTARVPDYNDIAQSLPAYLDAVITRGGPVAFGQVPGRGVSRLMRDPSAG